MVHLWTIDWFLLSDKFMQICVPPNIDLNCVLVLIFLCGLLSVSNDTDYINCFRQKHIHLSFLKRFFTFNTAVVLAEWASQNFKWSNNDSS